MGFGIKTKAKKTLYHILDYIKHPLIIYGELTKNSFPKNPFSKFRINARLESSLNDLKADDFKHNIGLLSARVDNYAVKIYQRFVSANGNNIGNWSIEPPEHGTRQLEYEVIQKLINLYKGQNENLEGYVTSGGTEGNLYSVWIGKAFVMQKYNLNQICLLKTSLTHYSIDKACLMYSIKFSDVPLDRHTWTMDPQALEAEIKKRINKGVYGFIISLTLGYTETGTSDNLQKINAVIKKLKKQYKKITISIIIDAAFNGLIEPFLTNDFRPFISKDIHIFSVDFSKFTAVPFPAGVVLYRKQLRKMIERDVQFFPVPDNTLLGSRPGASAAAIWGTIHYLGISGYKKIIERQIKVKNHFIKNILNIFPDVEIISDPRALTCGVIFTKKQFRMLPKQMEYQYRVYAKEESILFSGGLIRKIIICKFFFLSHMTIKSVDDIILSIKNSINEK